MKKIFYLLFFLPLLSVAQEPLSFSGVVEVPGTSKEQLFSRAKLWLNSAFNSMKDVTQHSDKEAGEVFIKGIMPLKAKYKYMGNHSDDILSKFIFNLWIKDGKYRYELKEFFAYYTYDNSIEFGLLTTAKECPKKIFMTPPKVANQMWESLKEGADQQSKLLIASLESAMKGSTTKEDW